MIRYRLWALLYCVAASPLHEASGQTGDPTMSSLVGGTLGGLAGIIVALPSGCGGVFSDKRCDLNNVARGFAIGDILGGTFAAARSGSPSSCGVIERIGRSLVGTTIGAGVSVAGVSQTHGNLRIGLTPLVQLASSAVAAAMVSPCRGHRASDDLAGLASESDCRNPSRDIARAVAALGLTGGYAGLYMYFHHAWWSGTPAQKWFVQNDWDQAERDSDKFGHLFGGYHLTRVTSQLLETACVAPSRAIVWAALYAYAFQFQIEEWDGTQQLYGFNPSDLIADAAGALFAVAQSHTATLRYIKPVWSYRPTAAYRNRNLPGHNGQPRATTDYAGQTYWFSTDIHGLLPDRVKPFWPSFIRLSPGYSITDYVDPATGGGLRAKRRFLFSLDLDPEKLPGDNRIWRAVLHELAFVRIPGPTIQLTPTRKFSALYY